MKHLLLLAGLFAFFVSRAQEKLAFDVHKSEAYTALQNWKDNVSKGGNGILDAKIIIDNNTKTAFQWKGYQHETIYSYYGNSEGMVTEYQEYIQPWGNSPGHRMGISNEKFQDKVTKAHAKFKRPKSKNARYGEKIQDYVINKSYVWDIVWKDEPAIYELLHLIQTKEKLNRRGKVKSRVEEGYVVVTIRPRAGGTKKPVIKTDSDAGIYIGSAIGVMKGEFFNLETIESFANVDGNNPKSYISAFIAVSEEYGIDMTNVKNNDIKVTFTSWEKGIIARALGMDKDCEVHIGIDLSTWESYDPTEKFMVMFHELSHDILNIRHDDGTRLMATTKPNKIDTFYVGTVINEMFKRASTDLKYRVGVCD